MLVARRVAYTSKKKSTNRFKLLKNEKTKYVSLVKVRFARSLQNVCEAYKAVGTMDNLISPETKFYDRSIGLVGLWFGGHFRELESPKVWPLKEILTSGSRKHAKSTQLIKRFPAVFSEFLYLICTSS